MPDAHSPRIAWIWRAFPVTESLAERAEALAWKYSLRGYDAEQLESALHIAGLRRW